MIVPQKCPSQNQLTVEASEGALVENTRSAATISFSGQNLRIPETLSHSYLLVPSVWQQGQVQLQTPPTQQPCAAQHASLQQEQGQQFLVVLLFMVFIFPFLYLPPMKAAIAASASGFSLQ